MKSRVLLFLSLVLFLTMSLVVLQGGVATANWNLQFTTCPSFTGPIWADPMHPSFQGNTYTLSLTSVVVTTNGTKKVYAPMTCSAAESWVKKLITDHIAGKPGLPTYPPLTNGPPGFVCEATPDLRGHAWAGHCNRTNSPPGGGVAKPAFTWST
jgi:hypothetical protein